MDDLFVVYRYLALNRNSENLSPTYKDGKDNPYNVAFQTIDAYVDMEREIAYYANKINKSGGLAWTEAEHLTERLLSGFETGLINYNETALATAIGFMKKYIALDNINKLIEACQEEKTRMIRE